MYYTYILLSLKDKRTYVGHTKDIENRLYEHNSGQVLSTKNRKQFRLFHLEKFSTIKKAKNRELWWKSNSGRKEMKKLFLFD